MRMIFIGPGGDIDPYVNSVMRERVQITKTPWDQKIQKNNIGTKQHDKNHYLYQDFLEQLQSGTEPIREVVMIETDHQRGKSELEILNGEYPGYRQWFDLEIPRMKQTLLEVIQTTEGCLFHIDLGDSFATLTYAYQCSLLRLSYCLTFHNPLQPNDPEMDRVSFAIGGHSPFARARPLLRRHMAVDAIRNAERVFVDQVGIGEALTSLFPQLEIQYFADPLTHILSEEDEQFLSSQVEEAG